MSLTRRSILRNFGAVTAFQSISALSGAALIGCSSRNLSPSEGGLFRGESNPPLSTSRVLFEGPWLFSRGANGQMRASAIMDGTHRCQLGRWNNGMIVNPSSGSANSADQVMLGAGNRYQASLKAFPMFDYGGTLGAAFKAAGAVYLDGQQYTVTPDPTLDIVVTLPVPNQVFVGGRLNDGTITDAANNKLNTMPYTTTILKYTQATGQPALTFAQTNGPAQAVTVAAGQDLVFRLMHTPCGSGADEKMHAVMAFAAQQGRIGGSPGLTLMLRSESFDANSRPDGLADDELGLAGAGTACGGANAAAVGPMLTMEPYYQLLSNCAGGGIGSGGPPCGGTC